MPTSQKHGRKERTEIQKDEETSGPAADANHEKTDETDDDKKKGATTEAKGEKETKTGEINIDEMETECSSMPWSGEPLFQASGLLSAPAEINTDDLLQQLDAIEEKLGVDITLSTTL